VGRRATGTGSRYNPQTRSTRLEYEKRVNRVIDHVRARLGEPLSLAEASRIAAFSPFHFHRVFSALTGETLFAYVQRQRIERAAGVLAAGPRPSILEVALDHGFASAATFARAFRARFGMSATEWRRDGAERRRRPGTRTADGRFRKLGKAGDTHSPDTPSRTRKEDTMSLAVRMLPGYHVAYMRYVGPYGDRGIPELWLRLRQWMGTRGLDPATTLRLGIGYDDAAITEPAKCSYDACAVVSADFAADRWVNLMDVPAGRFAVATFRGTAATIEAAWPRLFARWLPDSGYQPDDRAGLEIYRGAPEAASRRGGRVFRCELCLPVRAL
jgi:AraC family transcriptional regulator